MQIDEHATVLEPGLIAAYRATHYQVLADPAFTLRIDQASAPLATRLRASAAPCALFITAWNPHGVQGSAAENERRHARLLAELEARGMRWLPGFGAYPENRRQGERSVLVWGVDHATACALGRAQAQNAVVWAGADSVPRLVLLR